MSTIFSGNSVKYHTRLLVFDASIFLDPFIDYDEDSY